jgi:TolB-like protein
MGMASATMPDTQRGTDMAEGAGEDKTQANRPTIFISYASQDAALANAVVGVLERAGLKSWIAPRDIVPGALYAGEIVRAINESGLVVLVLSAHSAASTHVSKELERASSKRRRIIALRTDAAVLPDAFEYFLSESQWIEVGTGDIEPAMAKLAEAARRHLGSGLKSSVDGSRAVAVAGHITSTTESPTDRVPSIAVLPFANLSGDKEQEYFSDGLAEELINALAKIQGLKVIARSSAFAFRGHSTDIRRIAETLGVAHLLEGSVRRSGNRIRVTAQLISASDGSHLWSERYDRELAEVFAVQDEISAAISDALKVRLSPQAATSPRHTPTLPAYEALLKARHFHWKVTGESMDQAKGFYELAITLDPLFALAQALYADYLFGRTTIGLSPMREVAPAIRAAAQRALDLDASLVDAHGVLCVLAASLDYDWREAEKQFASATDGGRGSAQNHMACGWNYLFATGRRTDAVDQLRLAVQADPLHLTHRAALAMCLGAVHQFEEAVDLLQESQDLDANFVWTHCCLAELNAARQQFAEALPCAERAFLSAPWYAPAVGIYAGLLVRTGDPSRGREVVQALGAGERYGSLKGLAMYHIVCGDFDVAADWYERAIRARESFVLTDLQGAIGEPLRAGRNWPRLAALANLPVTKRP